MHGVSAVFTVIAVVIGVFLAVGAGLALIRGSYNKATIEALRGDNRDLRDRVNDLEHSESRHELKEQQLEATVDHQRTEIERLELLVTQRAKVEILERAVQILDEKLDAQSTLLTTHHDEAMVAWSEMIRLLSAGGSTGK